MGDEDIDAYRRRMDIHNTLFSWYWQNHPPFKFSSISPCYIIKGLFYIKWIIYMLKEMLIMEIETPIDLVMDI